LKKDEKFTDDSDTGKASPVPVGGERIFLPVCINITDKAILVVGGGRVAAQKLKTLLKYTRNITVCAPEIRPEIRTTGIRCLRQKYSPELLDKYRLVYACTDDKKLNRQIAADAGKRGILVNVADDPLYCDFISPAVFKQGDISVAVSSNGKNVKKSVRLRDRFRQILESENE